MSRTKTAKPKPAEVGPVRLTVMASRGSKDRGRWYWRGRRKAERDTIWTGWATRDEAMAAVAKLVARGLPSSARSEDRAAPRTVGELAARYLAYRKGHVWHGDARKKPKAKLCILPISHYKYQLHVRHLIAWIDDVPLGAVSSDVLTSYITNRRHADSRPAKSDRNVERELAFLGYAWIWAKTRGWVTGELPKVMPATIEGYVNNRRTPTPDEVRAVLSLLPGDYRLAVELMVYGGARVREITAKLILKDIDLDADVLHLQGKRGAVRAVPISTWHRAELARRKAEGRPDDLLIQALPEELALRRGSWRGIYAPTLSAKLARACETLGVPIFTAQGLRRMVDDALYDSNVDPGTSSKILGHSPEVALRAYRTVRQAKMREAMRGAGLDALLRPETMDNVIPLPGAGQGQATPDLSDLTTDLLLAELRRRQQEQASPVLESLPLETATP